MAEKTTIKNKSEEKTHDHRTCSCKKCIEYSEKLMTRLSYRSKLDRRWFHEVDLRDLRDAWDDDPVELAHQIGARIESQPWYQNEKHLPNGIWDLETFVSAFKGFKQKKGWDEKKTVEMFDNLMDVLWDYGDNLKVFFNFMR